MSHIDIQKEAPIKLTAGAVKQLLAICQEEKIPEDYGLRVGVEGGGCSGFKYILGFDEIKESDDVFELDNMKIIMNKAHAIHLLGMKIDWIDGLNNKGFQFINPNAKETCGCGTSFSS